MEVVADHRAGDRVALHQHAGDERGGIERGERGIEFHQDGAIEPGGRQQAQLRGRIGQAEQRLVRIEEGARMRLEGQRRRRPAKALRAGHRGADHRAMAAMHPLEIAHGDHRAHERAGMHRRTERVVDDDEGWLCGLEVTSKTALEETGT